MAFAFTMLLTALILSIVAAYYSIVGLTAIFSAAVIPIIIMGASLELGKIMATVWLHNNWQRASWKFKSYLVPAVLFLMLLTSMGIFGFLSKAHTDQNLVSGDVQSKIAIYDEKIKTARENIEANRKQLKQMDEAVDQVMGRSTDEKGADKAVSVRKNQSRDRVALAKDIEANQKLVAKLNDEAAPIRAEVRKVEAEVGPIKYIAALIYGDNPDTNILERAVRWVIILIVVVFDPLALCLLLASQQSLRWAREDKLAAIQERTVEQDSLKTPEPNMQATESTHQPDYEPDNGPLTETQIEQIKENVAKKFDIKDHPYLFTPRGSSTPPGIEPAPIQVYRSEPSDDTLAPCYKCGTPLVDAPGIGPFCPNKACDVFDSPYLQDEVQDEELVITVPIVKTEFTATMPTIVAEAVTPSKLLVLEAASQKQKPAPYVPPEAAHTNKKTIIKADNDPTLVTEISALFGTEFPKTANRGDLYLRVDYLPTRLYRYNSNNWMEIEKSTTDTYSYNEEYIKYLIEQLSTGTYDPDNLTASEKEQIEEYISKNDQPSNNPT